MKTKNILIICVIALLAAVTMVHVANTSKHIQQVQTEQSIGFPNNLVSQVSYVQTADAVPILCQDTEVTDEGSGIDFRTILNIVLGIVSVVFPILWAKSKGKFSQVMKLGKDLIHAGEEFENAIADNNITKQEQDELKKDYLALKEDFKALINFKSS